MAAQQQRLDLGRGIHGLGQHVEQHSLADGHERAQCRQGLQRGAQSGQLARAHLAQRDTGGDALHVAHVAQGFAQGVGRPVDQHFERVVPLRGDLPLAQRVGQPVAQRPAAHAGAAGVEQREQRGGVVAAQGLGEFEVAVGGGRQVEQVARALDRAACARGPAPGPACVRRRLRSAAAAAWATVMSCALKPARLSHPQLLAQLAGAECRVELPVRALGAPGRCVTRRVRPAPGSRSTSDLGGVQPCQPAGAARARCIRSCPAAAGQAQPGQTVERRRAASRASSSASRLSASNSAVGHRAGRDHAHHLALHRPLGGGHVADLLGRSPPPRRA